MFSKPTPKCQENKENDTVFQNVFISIQDLLP